MDLYPRIESQQWDFADSSLNAAVDFTAVYTEFYRESRVPELFDELVEELNRIVDSGEVDSLQAIKSLERLIATIKKNARGDFFSTRGRMGVCTSVYAKLRLGITREHPRNKAGRKSVA